MQREFLDWLATPLGKNLTQIEDALLSKVIASQVQGRSLFQLGGPYSDGLSESRKHYCYCNEFLPDIRKTSSLIQADLTHLPFQTASIEAILLCHVLDYHQHPFALLKEVNRVLKQDGHVFILGFNPMGLWRLSRWWPSQWRTLPRPRAVPLEVIKQFYKPDLSQVSCDYLVYQLSGVQESGQPNSGTFLSRLCPFLGSVYLLHLCKQSVDPAWIGPGQTFTHLPMANALGHTHSFQSGPQEESYDRS